MCNLCGKMGKIQRRGFYARVRKVFVSFCDFLICRTILVYSLILFYATSRLCSQILYFASFKKDKDYLEKWLVAGRKREGVYYHRKCIQRRTQNLEDIDVYY